MAAEKNVTGTRVAPGRAGKHRQKMAVAETQQKLTEFYMPVRKSAHGNG